MKLEFLTLYLWLASHRRPVLLVAVVLAGIFVAISSRIDLEEDILGILPQHDPIVEEYQYTVRKFHQIDRVYIDVGINRDDSDALGRAADEFYARLATNSSFARITYRIELGNQRAVTGFLTGALPNLFTTNDAFALDRNWTPIPFAPS